MPSMQVRVYVLHAKQYTCVLLINLSHCKLANLTPNLRWSHYFGHYKVERSDHSVRKLGLCLAKVSQIWSRGVSIFLALNTRVLV